MEHAADIAIVGAGILGLAHAYVAAKLGYRVVVFERSPRAAGASIRNFGMIWPIGQSPGPMHQMALQSRSLWLEILQAARMHYRATGSLHLAYRADEAAVLKEFSEVGPRTGYECQWQTPEQVLSRSQAVKPDGLLGGLWSPLEFTVDPRHVIAQLPVFLEAQYGVTFCFGTAVNHVEPPFLQAGGETWRALRVVICSGDDFETLYPRFFKNSGITRCKLQMMRTCVQRDEWRLGPSLAAGLTLRFYPSFGICRSLPALAKRIVQETPELEDWEIHVLVSQTADGAITLGDSHQYGLAVDVFDRMDIDRLIERYAAGFLRLPEWRIVERWHGVYAKHPKEPFISIAPAEGVRIVNAPGGSGMTLAFGLAEHTSAVSSW